MEMASSFCSWESVCRARAAAPSVCSSVDGEATMPRLRASQQPLLTLTLGLGNLHMQVHHERRHGGGDDGGGGGGRRRQARHDDYRGLELRGGRLDVGPHLPLLAGRWRYTKTIGEGVSAQAIEVEDVYDSVLIAADNTNSTRRAPVESKILVDNMGADDVRRLSEKAASTSSGAALEVERMNVRRQDGEEAAPYRRVRLAIGGREMDVDARRNAGAMHVHGARSPKVYAMKILKKDLADCGAYVRSNQYLLLVHCAQQYICVWMCVDVNA